MRYYPEIFKEGDAFTEGSILDAVAQVDRINRETLRYYGVPDLGASLPRIPTELFPHAQPDEWEFVD